MLSRQPDFSTEDREFAPGDTIYMKVDASEVDYSSVEYSAYRLISREGEAFYEGGFDNNFDGSYSGKVAVDDLELVDYFWNWEAEIRDKTGSTFNVRLFLRIGDPGEQVAGVEMRGLVQEKGDGTFVMLGQTVLVDDETHFEVFYFGDPRNPNPQPPPPEGQGSFDDVQVNYGVETRVVLTEQGTLLAKSVRVLGPFDVPRFVNVSGRIAEVDEASQTFVVRGLTIAVTEFTGIGGDASGNGGGFNVGQLVRVFGDFLDDGTVQAHFVEFRRAVQPELEVRGRVTALDGDLITIQGFQFKITDATVIERLADNGFPGGGSCDPAKGDCPPICDPNVQDCGTVCDPVTGECPPVCDPAMGDCPPVCDPAMGDCPPMCDPAMGDCPPVCDPAMGDCPPVCDPAMGDCPPMCDPAMGDCPPVCDPAMGDCPPVCDPVTGECKPAGKRAAAAVEDLQKGLIVRIVGVVGAAGTSGLTAEHILIESGDDRFVRLSGEVENVSDSGFTIRGWSITIDEYTPLFNEKYEQIAIEDLADGQLVMVFGEFIEDGQIRAHQVEFRLVARDQFSLFGPVTAMTDAGVTVWDVPFVLTENSRFELGFNQPLTREDVKVGMIVEVVSVPNAAGGWDVDVVRVPENKDEGMRISGLIENLTDAGFSVLGQLISLEPFAQIVDRQWEPLTFEDLAESRAVDVYGVFQGDGIRANTVVLNGKEREEIEFWGLIGAVEGDVVTVGGVPFVFSQFSKVFGEEGELNLVDLQDGLYVSIVGLAQEDGSFVVDRIFVPRQEDRSVRVSGDVEAIDEFGLTLWGGNEVVFNTYTHFHDQYYQPIDPTTVLQGARVNVYGVYQDDGRILANSVELRGEATSHIKLLGSVSAYDGVTLEVGGFSFLLTEQTQYFGNENTFEPGSGDVASKSAAARRAQMSFGPFAGKRVNAFDLAEGMAVEVFGVPDENGALVAVSVSLRDERGQVSMRGEIAEINGDVIRIRGRQIFTTMNTEVLNQDYQPMALADLVLNQGVVVSGTLRPDGGIDAFRIELRSGERPGLDLWGRVSGVQGDLVFVENVPFLTSDVTFFTAEDGSQVDLTTLQPGQFVSISGELDDTGVLTATVVFLQIDRVHVDMVGPVEMVAAPDFYVWGLRVAMAEWATVVDENYQPVDVTTLQDGDFVQVSGDMFEAESVQGHFAQRFGTDAREIELRGAISSLDGDLIYVNGTAFIYTQNTFINTFEGAPAEFGDLALGLKISIVGKPNEAGDILAARINIENQEQDEQVRMRGTISDVSIDGFMLLGRQVTYGEYVNIVGEGYEPITPDQLVDGQMVTVFGSLNRDGVVLAYNVEAFAADLEQLEFRGVVDAVEAGFVTIRGFVIAVDDRTFIQDERGFQLSPEKLTPGALVRVLAMPATEGTFRAQWMQLGAGQEDRGANLSGVITALDRTKRSLTIYGRKVIVEEYADIINESFERIPFLDLKVDQNVRVFGFYEDGGRIRAWRVESVGAENRELELRGAITEVDGSTIVVRGISFVLGPDTWIDGGDGKPFPAADLEAGLIVGITGTPLEDGTYRVRWIYVSSGNEDRNVRIAGSLVEADKSQRLLVIRDHKIYLNDQADIVGSQYEPISFDGLKVGANLQVWGWLQPDGKIEGWRAEVRVPEQETFHLTGALSEIGRDAFTVAGVRIFLTETTHVVAPDVGNISVENLFAGLIVEVEGGVDATNRLVARKVQVFNMDPRVALDIRGIVSNLGSDRFELAGIEVRFDAQTFVLDGNSRPLDPSTIQNNNNVDVVALEGDGDALLARFVQVFDLIRDEKTLVDRIATLGNDSFTMRGYTFRVDDETIMEDPLGNAMTFEDLFERMRVEVHAIEESEGVYLARTITARPRDQKLTGTLTDIGSSTIDIAGLEVTVDVTTEILDADGEDISLGDLVAGQTINLTFVPGAGGVPVATKIELLPRIEDEVVLTGTVEAAFGQLFVVLGRRFQVIPNTVFYDVDKNPITMDNFSVGDAVRVRGLLLAGDDLVALQVQQLGEDATDIRVEGPIVSVSASVLEVMNVFFFINEESLFYGLDGEETTVDAFVEGQTVSVIAEGQPNGSILLKRVSIQNVSLSQGEIGDIEGDQFTMFGTTYRVDENTIVLGDENAQLDLENLGDGQYVEVRGVAGSDGSVVGKVAGSAVLVSKVKIIDAEGSGEYELDNSDSSPTANEEETLPETFELHQNYPNPFNPVTTIRFALPQNARVVLKVYDVVGREVQTLVAAEMPAGTYDVQWNGRNAAGIPVASGVYLYRLDLGDRVMTRRMVLVK
ncbi:MAG: DUF5666 domain-containing protein [Rhodothermales bacterium]